MLEINLNKPLISLQSWKRFKYHIHPLLKLGVLIGFNIFAFLPQFDVYRYAILGIEIFLAVLIKLEIYRFKAFFKFLFLNFIPIFFLFYFIDFNWISALIKMWDYLLTTIIMFISVFLFYSITPPKELLIGFRAIRLPKPFALGITIGLTFLPYLTDSIRLTRATQEARGYKLRIWNLGPILIPSILVVLDLSINLAISLEARGYDF